VVIQQIVGKRHAIISIPMSPALPVPIISIPSRDEAEDGVASVVLGLGKTVVEAGTRCGFRLESQGDFRSLHAARLREQLPAGVSPLDLANPGPCWNDFEDTFQFDVAFPRRRGETRNFSPVGSIFSPTETRSPTIHRHWESNSSPWPVCSRMKIRPRRGAFFSARYRRDEPF